jgi:heme A synthase
VLKRYAWGVVAYNLLVIAWGAFVRATGSGAGCGSHWPVCNGEVLHRPETLETMVELSHRLTSGLALIAVLVLLVAAFRARPKGHPVRRWAVLSVVFMVLEAAIGAGLVLLELVADNQSSARAVWIALHLVNTFLLVAAMTLAARQAGPEATPLRLGGQGAMLWLLAGALVGTIVVGATGAVTALGDTLFPAGSLAEGLAEDFRPTAHFLVQLRIWHPVTAVVLALYVGGLAGLLPLLRDGISGAAGRVAGLVLLQIAGGFLNLLLLAPVWMQLVHLLLADVLWIALLLLAADALAAPRRAEAVPQQV